jgi:hypothetical protein
MMERGFAAIDGYFGDKPIALLDFLSANRSSGSRRAHD